MKMRKSVVGLALGLATAIAVPAAHAWLNLFGFVSLSVAATMIHLLPTVAGTRILRRRSADLAIVGLGLGPPLRLQGLALPQRIAGEAAPQQRGDGHRHDRDHRDHRGRAGELAGVDEAAPGHEPDGAGHERDARRGSRLSEARG